VRIQKANSGMNSAAKSKSGKKGIEPNRLHLKERKKKGERRNFRFDRMGAENGAAMVMVPEDWEGITMGEGGGGSRTFWPSRKSFKKEDGSIPSRTF